MLLKQKNSKKQGDAGLGQAIAWATSRGYTVSLPLTDSQPYDLIVDMDGKLQRIQVKTTSYRSRSHFYVSLTTKGGNRTGAGQIKKLDPTTVDFVFVVAADGEDLSTYLIPFSGEQSITLNKNKDTFKLS